MVVQFRNDDDSLGGLQMKIAGLLVPVIHITCYLIFRCIAFCVSQFK